MVKKKSRINRSKKVSESINRSENENSLATIEQEALARRQILIATLKAAAPSVAEELGKMNEVQLRERLQELDNELEQYKKLVEECKKENDELGQEIEESQRDSAEYTAYLLLKRTEKQSVINRLQGEHQKTILEYQKRRNELESKLNKETQELTEQIASLQEQLDIKNQEVVSLSDVLHQRQKHETQLAELKSTLETAESQHNHQVLQLERSLLEELVHVQRQNAEKVSTMQAEAQHQALTSLAEYTTNLSKENDEMTLQLKQAVSRTQSLQLEKNRLQDECHRLEREILVRERIDRTRMMNKVTLTSRNNKFSIQEDKNDEINHNIYEKKSLINSSTLNKKHSKNYTTTTTTTMNATKQQNIEFNQPSSMIRINRSANDKLRSKSIRLIHETPSFSNLLPTPISSNAIDGSSDLFIQPDDSITDQKLLDQVRNKLSLYYSGKTGMTTKLPSLSSIKHNNDPEIHNKGYVSDADP